jgi:hypothetical protein
VRPVEPFTTVEEEAEFWNSYSVVAAIEKGSLVGCRQAKKTKKPDHHGPRDDAGPFG